MNKIDVMAMNAIWLENPVTLGNGTRSPRIKENDLIQIENGKIIDCEKATHIITGCHGTIDSSVVYITTIDLNTNQSFIFKL